MISVAPSQSPALLRRTKYSATSGHSGLKGECWRDREMCLNWKNCYRIDVRILDIYNTLQKEKRAKLYQIGLAKWHEKGPRFYPFWRLSVGKEITWSVILVQLPWELANHRKTYVHSWWPLFQTRTWRKWEAKESTFRWPPGLQVWILASWAWHCTMFRYASSLVTSALWSFKML